MQTTNQPERKFLKSEVTPQFITELKAKYEKVHCYATKNGLHQAWFKQPDLIILDANLSMAKRNPIRADEMLANATFIGGDMEVISVKKYFLGLRLWLGNLIEIEEGEFTEL